MRGTSAWPSCPLPSAALPASGSRGSIDVSCRSSQPGGSPALSFSVRIRLARAKSMVGDIAPRSYLRERWQQIRAMSAWKAVAAAKVVAMEADFLLALLFWQDLAGDNRRQALEAGVLTPH